MHCDYIWFKPVKPALRGIKLSKEEKQERRVGECLVVFTAVEASDDLDIVSSFVANIEEIADKVNAKRIVLYPYAHLSSNLASAEIALDVLKKAEQVLKEKGYEVVRAPFDYYKAFELRCKGHPLAELSRSFGAREKISEKADMLVIKGLDKKIDIEKEVARLGKWLLDKRELSTSDHRIIGQQLDLFSFHDVASSMVFWHPKGMLIRKLLIEFSRQEHSKRGYEEILTPQIMDVKLWKISGHWDYYRDFMFLATNTQKELFAVKPMNCPGHILIYKTKARSYRELPIRWLEFGIVHRNELSGVTSGMFRVKQITQDDAHIFCTEEQLEEEIKNVIELIDYFYKIFGFSYRVELSTRPDKRIGSDEIWDLAENALRQALDKLNIAYKVNEGEGAFYGPKIDFHIKDSLGREWQCATIQLDFSMPERFKLEYIDENGKSKRPIMLHRTVYGSIERFTAILLEHYQGKLPLWLSPVQIKVLSFTERNTEHAEKIAKVLEQEGFRVERDFSSRTLDYKVREAELEKVPYIVVIGDKEQEQGTIAVRKRGNRKVEFGVKLQGFVQKLKQEIEEKK